MAHRSFLQCGRCHREHERVHLRPRRVVRAVRIEGGGEALAAAIGAPLLGQIPLEPSLAAGNDAGAPVAIDGTGAAADMFRSIAAHIIDEIAPPSKPEDIDMAGCSARLFDSDDAAFAELETAVTVGPR